MKLYPRFIISLLLLSIVTIEKPKAQTDFDSKVNALCDSIAKKINAQAKTKIAVWDFTDTEGQITNLGKYISEEVSVDLTNYAQSFSMMDRNHLNAILKEHKLNSEGFIDANTAKELGKMKAVDAIVTGTVTVFGNKIKLTMKVLDTETALIIAATKGDLPINDDVASFIGVPGINSDATTANRGFNRPINSNEQFNNPETVNKECEAKNVGDYCFTNTTKYRLHVELWAGGNITLEPNQTQCYYNIKVGSSEYTIADLNYVGENLYHGAQGRVLIEKCKSKTFIIK